MIILNFIGSVIGSIVLVAVCVGFVGAILAIALLPTLNAYRKNHKHKQAIMAVNILFSWTFIGWAIAMVWSLT